MVIYLNPTGHNRNRIIKADDHFEKRCDYKDIKFTVIIRNIHKIEKKNGVFGYENKEKYPINVLKKCWEEKHIDLLFIGEGEIKTMFLSMISID